MIVILLMEVNISMVDTICNNFTDIKFAICIVKIIHELFNYNLKIIKKNWLTYCTDDFYSKLSMVLYN